MKVPCRTCYGTGIQYVQFGDGPALVQIPHRRCGGTGEIEVV